ncbi:MAG: DUF2782 domain-containing protein [Mariprofundales bacterium]
MIVMMLAPAAAWGGERNPMPPPTTSHHAHQSSTTTSEQQAIAEVEGSDIRAYTRQDGTKISEYSRQGRVYMIKVKPPGDLPAYYLYDERGNGQFSRRLPGGYQPVAPPQWVVKEF